MRNRRFDEPWEWRRTICCDESAIRLNATTRLLVTRKAGEAFKLECTVPKLLGGGISIMVWGAIYYGGRSELWRFDTSDNEGARKGVTGQLYMEQITSKVLKRCWDSMKRRHRGYGAPRILEDNASIHRSVVKRGRAAKQGFKYLDHPPSSPDLNPIKNIWSYLKVQVAARTPRPTTPDGLFAMAREEWEAIPQAMIDRAIDSMPRQLREVRRLYGYATKY